MSVPEIQTLLAAALPGAAIEILDDSARHAGHRGNTGGGHYFVQIIWPGFEGMNRLARQRHIHETLQKLFQAGRIHALQLTLRTPAEAL